MQSKSLIRPCRFRCLWVARARFDARPAGNIWYLLGKHCLAQAKALRLWALLLRFPVAFAKFQIWRAEVFGSFAGHCRLHGRGLKAPVITPSCRKGNCCAKLKVPNEGAACVQRVQRRQQGQTAGFFGGL